MMGTTMDMTNGMGWMMGGAGGGLAMILMMALTTLLGLALLVLAVLAIVWLVRELGHGRSRSREELANDGR